MTGTNNVSTTASLGQSYRAFKSKRGGRLLLVTFAEHPPRPPKVRAVRSLYVGPSHASFTLHRTWFCAASSQFAHLGYLYNFIYGTNWYAIFDEFLLKQLRVWLAIALANVYRPFATSSMLTAHAVAIGMLRICCGCRSWITSTCVICCKHSCEDFINLVCA